MRSRHNISLVGLQDGRNYPIELAVRDLVLAGWTGRNAANLAAHIRELAVLGIETPARTPIFYRVASILLTTSNSIQVIGTDSTGEVEFVLLPHSGEIWVGLGSDHTDRKAEAHGITFAKQLCAKPLASEVWCLSEIEPHWDDLTFRAWASSNGRTELYQQDKVAVLRHPRNLIELYQSEGGRFDEGTVIFSGTPAALRNFEWADRFTMELEDPVLGRSLKHSYEIRALENRG